MGRAGDGERGRQRGVLRTGRTTVTLNQALARNGAAWAFAEEPRPHGGLRAEAADGGGVRSPPVRALRTGVRGKGCGKPSARERTTLECLNEPLGERSRNHCAAAESCWMNGVANGR